MLSSPHFLLALAVVAAGLALVAAAAVQRRRSVDLATLLVDDTGWSDDGAISGWDAELERPLVERLLSPAAERLSGAVRAALPSEHLARVRRKLMQAGLTDRLRAEEYVTLQVLVAGTGVVLAVFTFEPTPRSAALSLLLVIVALLGPRALLDNRRNDRVERIQRELPDTIDLLAVCVEAGQGLEGAMQTVTARGEGVLATELRHTLRELELGVTRRGALTHLRDRVDVPDVSTLVAALIQADTLGTPVGDVLHDQAIEQRRRRRQQVREQAAKLPVKMLFPLTFFVLPALFVVVLGPAAMTIMGLFG